MSISGFRVRLVGVFSRNKLESLSIAEFHIISDCVQYHNFISNEVYSYFHVMKFGTSVPRVLSWVSPCAVGPH